MCAGRSPGQGVSDLPEQEVVGAVVPSHRLAAVGESEVLVAVAAGYDQVVAFRRDVGGGSAPRRVPPLQVRVDCAAAALTLVA